MTVEMIIDESLETGGKKLRVHVGRTFEMRKGMPVSVVRIDSRVDVVFEERPLREVC
jgi:hypothetical protein